MPLIVKKIQSAPIIRRVNCDGRLKFSGRRLKAHSGLAGREVSLTNEIFPGEQPGLAIWEMNRQQQPISLVKTYLLQGGEPVEPILAGGPEWAPHGWADRFPPTWPRVGPIKEYEQMLKIISACYWGKSEFFGWGIQRPPNILLRYRRPTRYISLYSLAGENVGIKTEQAGREFTLEYVKLGRWAGGIAVYQGRRPSRKWFQGVWQLVKVRKFLNPPLKSCPANDFASFFLAYGQDLAMAAEEEVKWLIPKLPHANLGPSKAERKYFLETKVDQVISKLAQGFGKKATREAVAGELALGLSRIEQLKEVFGPQKFLVNLTFILDKIKWYLENPGSADFKILANWLKSNPMVKEQRQASSVFDRFVRTLLEAKGR